MHRSPRDSTSLILGLRKGTGSTWPGDGWKIGEDCERGGRESRTTWRKDEYIVRCQEGWNSWKRVSQCRRTLRKGSLNYRTKEKSKSRNEFTVKESFQKGLRIRLWERVRKKRGDRTTRNKKESWIVLDFSVVCKKKGKNKQQIEGMIFYSSLKKNSISGHRMVMELFTGCISPTSYSWIS